MKSRKFPLRKAFLPIAGTAVAVGAFLGIPMMKSLAAAQDWRVSPRLIPPPAARLNAIQPARVNPTAVRLVGIAEQALADPAMADRMFNDPDGVAAQHSLSEDEKRVLRHMTREHFAVAQGDAARISAERLSQPGSMRLPADLTDPRLIAGRMVVGRAILDAMGRSYLEAANAHACCPWGKAIELGLNGRRVLYDRIFDAPNLDLRQPGLEVQRLDERG